MDEFLQVSLAWPTFPLTVLMGFVAFYWGLVILGTLDFEFLDFDLDIDPDADLSILHLGLVPLKSLNLGSVPLMIWLTVFAVSSWMLSMTIDADRAQPEFSVTMLLCLGRNVGIAVVLTKILTQPLKGRFGIEEPNPSETLLGKMCVIASVQATPDFGQAEYTTDAAPLLLNIRSTHGTLTKGQQAEIVEFDSENNVYMVTGREESSSDTDA